MQFWLHSVSLHQLSGWFKAGFLNQYNPCFSVLPSSIISRAAWSPHPYLPSCSFLIRNIALDPILWRVCSIMSPCLPTCTRLVWASSALGHYTWNTLTTNSPTPGQFIKTWCSFLVSTWLSNGTRKLKQGKRNKWRVRLSRESPEKSGTFPA